MSRRFDRTKLQAGDWVHVRSTSWLGNAIRRAQDHMLRHKYGADCPPVWGNHDGMFLPPQFVDGKDWGIGEALGKGSVITPIADYEKEMASGKTEVHVYRVVVAQANPEYGMRACRSWLAGPYKEGYDYVGILLYAWASYGWQWLGLGNMALWLWTHSWCSRAVRWCTEAVNDAWLAAEAPYVGAVDVCQNDKEAAPFNVEQSAGQLPRPRGMKSMVVEITADVVIPA